MFPLTSIVNAASSFEPPLTLKVPVTFKTPVAPAYFPVPPVMVAVPVILIVVGADSSSAQPFALESKLTLRELPPPAIDPFASNVSHNPAGAADFLNQFR